MGCSDPRPSFSPTTNSFGINRQMVFWDSSLFSAWLGGWGLLGQVVHGADEVEDLHHVHPRDAEPASTARHVVRLVHPVAVERARENLRKCEYRENFWFIFHLGCAAHEVVEEVVGELDQVHDGFGTLQDLPVQGSLDVRLNVLDKILLNILLEFWIHESCLRS